MNPPTVRTLDQLVAETNPIYDPQRQAIQQRTDIATQNNTAQEAGLAAAQQTAFGDITQAATRRGALFSGFTPDQQARYTSEKYLPALANLRAASQNTIQGLNDQAFSLDSDQKKTALGTREGDLSRLYDYDKTQSERKFQTEQANIAYEREMQKLRAEQSFQAAQNAQANKTPSVQEALLSLFKGYKPAYEDKTQAYRTEREIIPALMSGYGMTKAQATQVAFQYRRDVYGEK